MKKKLGIAGLLTGAAAGLILLRLYAPADVPGTGGKGGYPGLGAQEEQKGPNGGRILVDDNFAVEVTIFERDVPPEFRVYCYDHERPLDPARVSLTIELARFGGRIDRFHFVPQDGHLRGDQTVEEPHAFDVKVIAEEGGRTHRWEYSSYEGRTELSPEAIRASGIVIETAGPASVATRIHANGRVVPNEDRLAQVIPRYPGIVKEIRKRLGERVAANDVLAIVESNESLQPYEVRSSIAGTVIHKDAIPGELAREGHVIYTVADLGTVWVDLNVYPEDFRRLRIGQSVSLESSDAIVHADGKIVYLSPVGSENTQTLLARAELPNPEGDWRPGLFATGEIVVEEATVPVAVRTSALQTFRDWDVVFLNDGALFQAMPVEIGRRGEEFVEILKGVDAGQKYAAEGSFIIKADIGKSGAVHEH